MMPRGRAPRIPHTRYLSDYLVELLSMPSRRTSENAVKKLSEKGYEQRSEHGFGRYSGAKTGRKMSFGCLMRPRPEHLRDFSDSFKAKFTRIARLHHSPGGRSAYPRGGAIIRPAGIIGFLCTLIHL